MLNKKITLAITIPYYKIKYFEEVLNSLSRQTSLNFNVYIGDDASPDSPKEIIDKYRDKLNIFYSRFETNLGSKSLTKQWDRTAYLNQGEEWLWVLPDDDVPSIYCVEVFYQSLSHVNKHDIKVLRMPMEVIDSKGSIVNFLKYNEPIIEDNLAFYNRIIRGKTFSSLGDNIFHRQSFEDLEGFVEFPKAWGADHATVLKVVQGGNLYFLKDALLSFRMSGDNISSDTSDGMIKMASRIQFAQWLKENEHIFPKNPDKAFYHYFYWKGEYYVLNEWNFSFGLFGKLYTLRKVCFQSSNILPILKVFYEKVFSVIYRNIS